MKTKLVEFNVPGGILRGIVVAPNAKPEKGAIFLQGFERNAAVEKKFRRFADALADRGVVSLRYDAAGCGLSDGDFFKTTLHGRGQELAAAVNFFQKEYGNIKISFVAHSLGMCALALKLNDLEGIIGKMVFIAPALNQRNLMRYYFVRDTIKAKGPSIGINWSNYKDYLNEDDFQKDCARPSRMMRENLIGRDYFWEAKDIDMSNYFDKLSGKILHIHGELDRSVPLASLNTVFGNRIIVTGGDHDLERPDFFKQWFPVAVDFLAA